MIDTVLVMASLFLAFLLRFEFSIPEQEIAPLVFAFPIYMIVRVLLSVIGKTYAGIIRYSGTEDTIRILKVICIGSLIFCILNMIKFYGWDEAYFLPFSIIIIDAILAAILMITFRLSVKLAYVEIKNPRSERKQVVIYGAGESGIITKRTIDRDGETRYRVIAFVDDDPSKQGKRMDGVTIYHTDKLDGLLLRNSVTSLIISIQNPKVRNRRRVIEASIARDIQVLNVPPVNSWINGELSFNQIKDVKIDDLLGREVIKLKDGKVEATLTGKTVLVTGAAGSIGSGLVRQIVQYKPKLVVCLDQAESPIYDLENELRSNHPYIKLEMVIGDICRKERVKNLFQTFKPDIVFHAAAYKHVPLMELNPSEAVLTNVFGSKTLVDLAIENEVKTFVFISTDKAVNPTNVMGGSKRIAEIYAQSSNGRGETKFVTTRFGNVLGSNGSVIPLFKKQIEAGGPLTVTHPEVTRYFMTIPEACQLVLEAGAFGQGGEIFVFDMGESVKILDLAKQMIHLSGLELDKDISIKITGLRPGEKLYEELLNSEESTLETHHPQIKIAKVRTYSFEEVNESIIKLVNLFEEQDNDLLVKEMKEIVPEFKSNNSEFSKLDT
ncbi:MAG: polysaccharide biosynthesis protein [Flavobacteriales bacterium]|nr:polysaccharide biosynthesis protein [Flavobacteriales bacterium]